MYVPFWTVQDGFEATIHIRNADVRNSVTVEPILYSPEGREFLLEETTLASQATASIRLAPALRALGTGAPTRGTAALRYRASVGTTVAATLSLTQAQKSLAFQFTFLGGYAGSASRTLESAWWFLDGATQGRVALFNTSEEEISVSPTLFVDGLDYQLPPRTLAAHSLAELDLRRALQEKGLANATHGGLRLQYTGGQFALQAAVLLFHEERGFSHQAAFIGHDLLHREIHPAFGRAQPLRLVAPSIMIGEPPAEMGFAPGTRFTPWVLLRNATDEKIALRTRFTYMQGGTPVDVPLPIIALFPQETLLVDMSRYVAEGIIPEGISSGSLSVAYEGYLNTVLLSAASVDQAGNFVQTANINRGGVAGTQGAQWQTDGGYNTIVTVQNIESEPVKVQLTLDFNQGGGRYRLPPVRLAPGAIHTFDLKALQGQGFPDVEGRLWPRDATSGGYSLELVDSPVGLALVTDVGIFNPVLGTCEPPPTSICLGFLDLVLNPPLFSGSPGGTTQLKAKATWYNGTKKDVTGQTTFSSSNAPVISVQNGGTNHGWATCNNVGTATITGQAELPEYSEQVGPVIDIICFAAIFEAFSDGEVPPAITIGPLTAVGKNFTADVDVTITPSIPVTLALSTTSGTGSAVFTANNSTSLVISSSGTVGVRGVTQSSTANNIRLSAKWNNQTRATRDFTVVLITLSLRTSGGVSADNAGLNAYQGVTGTSNLGLFITSLYAGAGAEIVGTVSPSNYTGSIILRRTIDLRDYLANTLISSQTGDDTSFPEFRDDDPQSGASMGKVYDLDAPGYVLSEIQSQPVGTILRTRANFVQFAECDGKRCSLNCCGLTASP